MPRQIVLRFDETIVNTIAFEDDKNKIVTEGGMLKVMSEGKPVLSIPLDRVHAVQWRDVEPESGLIVPKGVE